MRIFVFGMIVFLGIMSSSFVFAQVEEQAIPASDQKTTEWVWGEVVSVDKDNRQLTVKHLDYDTYDEIQTVLTLDDKTLLENVSDLGEVQPGDHVTVDYRSEAGSNIAGLMVIEKKDMQKEQDTTARLKAPATELIETPVVEQTIAMTQTPQEPVEEAVSVAEVPATGMTDAGNEVAE
ncbi:MAG: hypothetical protein HZB36_08050 [Candidatus Omnitrophica bacterium]|nr:hypothetical protein [Candidatus Omnitrophota bacterium]